MITIEEINTIPENIIVCKYCGEIDITKEHENNCSYEYGEYKTQEQDILWN